MIHNLANFFCVSFGKRASKNSKILTKNINQFAINFSISSNYPISGYLLFIHSKIYCPVFNKHIPFLKAVLVQQDIKPFSSC